MQTRKQYSHLFTTHGLRKRNRSYNQENEVKEEPADLVDDQTDLACETATQIDQTVEESSSHEDCTTIPPEQVILHEFSPTPLVFCNSFCVTESSIQSTEMDISFFPFPSHYVAQAVLETVAAPALTREHKEDRLKQFQEFDERVPCSVKSLEQFLENNVPLLDYKVYFYLFIFIYFLHFCFV
jgi:hypothetical protein